MLTIDQLKKVYREAPIKRLELFLPHLNEAIELAELQTPQRLSMFLAQVGHESGQLRYTEEIASGQAYEGRVDLGNTLPGDGKKYKGRGLIQLTGKANYLAAMLDLDLDLLENPELLAQPREATMVAAWFWRYKNLNSYCDRGDFKGLTKRINGGYNGMKDREMLYQRAKEVYGIL